MMNSQCVFGQTALTEVHSRTDLPDQYARARQTCMTAIWALPADSSDGGSEFRIEWGFVRHSTEPRELE